MSKYQQSYRRMLVDMHIPDWDPAFLSRYDPAAMAEQFARANLTGAMLYCKSHAGLCYWPTKAGKMHAGVGGRDLVGEMLTELRTRSIAACAYYSIVFDNWAVETHPDWRQRTINGADFNSVIRYGTCCMNHPEYRAYEIAQLDDLLLRYEFDALFLDMIFWPLICGCDHCRARFRAEADADIPVTVDWTSPAWCRFQAARERWASDFTRDLMAKAKSIRPDLDVTHNLAPALSNWVLAQPLGASIHDTFVAGDLYGDRVEQLVVSKMLLHLSETRPAEFMTSVCVDLSDHVRLKNEQRMRAQAMGATAMSSAFLFIDAIDPIGTVNPEKYARVGRVFAATAGYEPFLGGDPIEDVAIYFSAHSQMDFAENGTPVASVLTSGRKYPHLDAVRGACRALQRAHIPFGVITRRQLDELQRFRAVVLPNVLRMDREEIEAIRAYVKAGGRLYASRYTSLVEESGTRHRDFMLADVFGASFDSEEQGAFAYLTPADEMIATWIAPQRHVSCKIAKDPIRPASPLCGLPRLRSGSGRALATLTLPYGYPSRGSVNDHQWASIHSSPPWEQLSVPTIVTNEFGAGRAIYSAASIEAIDGEAETALFVGLVGSLLDGRFSSGAVAHPSVWMTTFDQPDRHRVMASFLNYQEELPPAPVPVRFWLRPPAGKRFRRLMLAPEGVVREFTLADDGALHADLGAIELMAMVIAEYD
jgi:hypothetical protein